jgi:hypothetical protein
MFMIRHRKEFDDNRILPLLSNLLLEVVIAYAIYSICVDVGLSLAALYTLFYSPSVSAS